MGIVSTINTILLIYLIIGITLYMIFMGITFLLFRTFSHKKVIDIINRDYPGEYPYLASIPENNLQIIIAVHVILGWLPWIIKRLV